VKNVKKETSFAGGESERERKGSERKGERRGEIERVAKWTSSFLKYYYAKREKRVKKEKIFYIQ
jgi:hypothetical protein